MSCEQTQSVVEGTVTGKKPYGWPRTVYVCNACSEGRLAGTGKGHQGLESRRTAGDLAVPVGKDRQVCLRTQVQGHFPAKGMASAACL